MKTLNRIKKITPESAYILFALLFILFCTKAFSNPKLPNTNVSNDCETRMGYSVASKPNAMPSKSNDEMRSKPASKVRLKVAATK